MELSQLKITFECLGLGGNEEEEILTALNIYISKQFNYKYIRILYKYNMIYKYTHKYSNSSLERLLEPTGYLIFATKV